MLRAASALGALPPAKQPLLRWVLSLRQSSHPAAGGGPTLVLALDATLVRDRLAVLSVSVVFRGSALPVAWKILRANTEGSWVEPCRGLFERLSEAVGPEQTVLVLTDRGLQSRRLFAAITEQGWHPMMRLVRLGLWREKGLNRWHALARLLPGPGSYYLGQGHLFKSEPMRCTLLALWEEGYDQPWLLMTDLTPAQCRSKGLGASCYGMRSWIEQGFRCLKSGAYHCERMRIADPERAERVWLVLAVSLLWSCAIGSAAGVGEDGTALEDRAALEDRPLPGLLGLFRVGVRRVLGVHRSGWIELLVAALRGESLPFPQRLIYAPLPTLPPGLAQVSILLGPNPPP